MAPSKAIITKTCRAIVDETFNGPDRESLTIRFVRNKVEEELGFEEGFLLRDEWKALSKQIIKEYVDELINVEGANSEAELGKVEREEKPKPKAVTVPKKKEIPVKKGTKRASTESKDGPKKRRKKEESESELSDILVDDLSAAPETDVDLSDFGGESDSDAPKKKKGTHSKVKSKPQVKRQTKKKAKVEDEDEDDKNGRDDGAVRKSEDRDAKSPPRKMKKEPARNSLPKKAKAESDSELEQKKPSFKHEETEQKPPRKLNSKPIPNKPEDSEADTKTKAETKPEDSESEMSVLLDEAPPKPKRKKGAASEFKKPSTKPKSSSTSNKEPTADEAQLKTLQSQLLKCGVRKIWGFELKQYGDDTKAKIRHLQRMLKDIGMTGRFSNERAKEIKEMRELQADLEAVKEGESKWGLDGGKRKARPRGNMKDSAGTDEDQSGDEDAKRTRSRSVSEKPKGSGRARDAAARAKADLAFLGDESDSD